jgi:hypothetical protein
MDFNQIMVVGDATTRFQHHAFLSDANFPEFRIVIITIPGLVAEVQTLALGHGSAPAIRRTMQRFARLDHWVHEGHSLIVIVPSSPLVPALGEGGYQFIAEKVFAGISFVRNTGQLVDYCGPPPPRSNFLDPGRSY